jgi:sulfide:quinone oxidoreductase
MKKILVVGTGFGALAGARYLRKQASKNTEIIVLSPRRDLLYYPSLIWIPTGLRQPENILIPLGPFFKKNRITYLQEAVTGIEDRGRTVVTDQGRHECDALLIAGGSASLKKLPGIENSFSICQGIEEAIAIRDRLQSLRSGTVAFGFSGNPDEPSAVRGGPVFELLFGVDTWLRKSGRRNRIDLVFFSPAKEPGNRLGPKAVRDLLGEMARRKISTHLGAKLKSFSRSHVTTEQGEFPADLIVFTPGLRGPDWIAGTSLPRSPGGFIKAARTCQVEGMPGVFVAGDMGAYPGPDWMPKQGHSADLQAETAARNILTYLQGGKGTREFRVELVCVVDTLDGGTFVYRTPSRNILLKNPLFHNAKSYFERRYLDRYR